MGCFAGMLKSSDFNYSEEEMIQRTLLAHAMTYFMRGVPIIYYGDEQGFVGDGGDKDSRQDMMPSLVESYNDDDLLSNSNTTADDNFDESHMFYQSFSQYADIFYQYPALRFGEQKTLYSQKTAGIFAISRTMSDGDKMVVVFNTAQQSQPVNLSVDMSKAIQVYPVVKSETKLTKMTSISGLSFSIFKIKS
jgi:glycosidase